MKKAFFLLLAWMVLLYSREALIIYNQSTKPAIEITGKLSDVAGRVCAIPLQKAGDTVLNQVHSVQEENNTLFVVNEGSLYRYDKEGNFICQISSSSQINLATYLVDPLQKQVIVLGNTNDIHYYSYHGELIESKLFDNDAENHRLLSAALINNRIWTLEESVSGEHLIERMVVEYDTSFYKQNTFTIGHTEIGRACLHTGCLTAEFAIKEDKKELYIYSPSIQPDYLLEDSLYIHQKYNGTQDTDIEIYPVREGKRFMVSAYTAQSDLPNYLFCYDKKNNTSLLLEEGLKDDFYHTGQITNLQSLGVSGDKYWYVRNRGVNKEFRTSPVVFLVDMKG